MGADALTGTVENAEILNMTAMRLRQSHFPAFQL